MSFGDVEKGYGPRRSFGTGGYGNSSGYGYSNGTNNGVASSTTAQPVSPTGGFQEDPMVVDIRENIKQMSNNVNSITKMVSQLGTNKDSTELRARLYAHQYAPLLITALNLILYCVYGTILYLQAKCDGQHEDYCQRNNTTSERSGHSYEGIQ